MVNVFKIKYVGWCHVCKYYGPEGGFTSNEIASWFVDHNHQLVDCVMEFV